MSNINILATLVKLLNDERIFPKNPLSFLSLISSSSSFFFSYLLFLYSVFFYI